MLTKRVKTKIIATHQTHEKDTGSAEVQVAVLTRQIEELTSHLKKHTKDQHSRRGLLKMVSARRRFLEYLKKKSPRSYAKTVKALALKK